MKKTLILSAVFCALFTSAHAHQLAPARSMPAPVESAQISTPLKDSEIRDITDRALNAFKTPGMSVSIVKDGKAVFTDGFGVRDMESRARVNADTLFRIASTTKAFTSAALAILVDEGKLDWDDKVIDTLPDFKMMDPWVTREFTIRDLLVHRSGLGIGAGDLMLWPEPSGFTRDEIIHQFTLSEIDLKFPLALCL